MYIDIHTTSMSSIGLLVLKQGRNNSGHSCYQYMLLPVQQNWPAPPQFAHRRTTATILQIPHTISFQHFLSNFLLSQMMSA